MLERGNGAIMFHASARSANDENENDDDDGTKAGWVGVGVVVVRRYARRLG